MLMEAELDELLYLQRQEHELQVYPPPPSRVPRHY